MIIDPVTCPECTATTHTTHIWGAYYRSTCHACDWTRDWRTPRPSYGRRRYEAPSYQGVDDSLRRPSAAGLGLGVSW